MRERTHLPVIVDPSHAAGVWSLVIPLSAGSLAAGACGLIVEVHPDPPQAMSDGSQSLDVAMFAELAAKVHPGRERSEGPAVPERTREGRQAKGAARLNLPDTPSSVRPRRSVQGTVVRRRPTKSR